MVQRNFENRAKQLLIHRVIKGNSETIGGKTNNFYISEELYYPVNFSTVTLSPMEFRSLLGNKVNDRIYAKICTGKVHSNSRRKIFDKNCNLSKVSAQSNGLPIYLSAPRSPALMILLKPALTMELCSYQGSKLWQKSRESISYKILNQVFVMILNPNPPQKKDVQ